MEQDRAAAEALCFQYGDLQLLLFDEAPHRGFHRDQCQQQEQT